MFFNREVLDNIFAKKKELEARLRGIQRRLETVDSTHLHLLQQSLFLRFLAQLPKISLRLVVYFNYNKDKNKITILNYFLKGIM